MHFVLYLKSETVSTFCTHTYKRANTHTHAHTQTLTHIILIDARWEKCLTSSLLSAANAVASPSCSRWSTAPAGPVALWPQDLCDSLVMEEQCQLGHILGEPTDLGRRKQPKSVPIPCEKTSLQVEGGHSPGTSAISASPFARED